MPKGLINQDSSSSSPQPSASAPYFAVHSNLENLTNAGYQESPPSPIKNGKLTPNRSRPQNYSKPMPVFSSSASSSSPPVGKLPSPHFYNRLDCLPAQNEQLSQSIHSTQLPIQGHLKRSCDSMDDDPALTEVMLSLLARREAEHRTTDRRGLQAEKRRRSQLAFPGLAVDQSGGLEQCLALAESVPSGLRELTSPMLTTLIHENSADRLPGDRGIDAPSETFLSLACEMAGESAEPFDKIFQGTLYFITCLLTAGTTAQEC